ncbi:MAG: GGDEF domain-containing protein [Actinomycetia bacterium]|nr:GGDEF domain-containing protein [Actinomycetes bacterium]MCP4958208.1 GGDEF domain-containing protein [Actinomycetes bacterium]
MEARLAYERTTDRGPRSLAVERRDASLVRRARGVAAVAVASLLVTLQLPDDPAPLVAPVVVAVLVGLGLLLVNVLDPARRDGVESSTLRRAALWQLMVDSGLVVGVVWLAGADPRGPLWVLLVLPILEASLRFGARAAMWTIGAMSVAYVLRDVFSAARYEAVTFSPAVVLQRVGALTVIGVTAGFLAAELAREAGRHRRARSLAEQHSATLEVVADAARRMTSLDRVSVLRNLQASARELGFDRVAVADWNGAIWQAGSSSGESSDAVMEHLVERVAREVARSDRRVTLGPEQISKLAGDSDLVAAAAVPVRSDGEVVAVLVVGGVVSDELLGALELMSAHAGVVLTHASAHAEIQRLQQKLQHQAFHDSLTGLPNRDSFALRFQTHRDRRAGAATGVAVLFMDLDGFKVINDTLGHAAGDELLAAVGRRIRDSLRPTDMVARLGGDEFVALLEKVVDLEGARVAAERVLASLEADFVLAKAKVRLSASIGVVFRENLPEDVDELLRKADEAMYVAKHHGKARVVVIDDPNRSDEQLAG